MVETFPIMPASARWLWYVFGGLAVLFAAIMGLLIASARGAYASRFELSPDGLRLRGDLYGRLIAPSSLRGAAARIVDLRLNHSLVPVTRTLGTAIPGYQSGWFRLADGTKALLYLTDRTRAVFVPTTAGYSLLISPQDPERFLARLRAIAPAA